MALDYDCWWHLPPLFNPGNYAHTVENHYKGIASLNMLCIPTERKAEIKGICRVSGPKDRPRHSK